MELSLFTDDMVTYIELEKLTKISGSKKQL